MPFGMNVPYTFQALMNAFFKPMMSAYFCSHSVFNSRYLIEFVCLKSDLIDNSDN